MKNTSEQNLHDYFVLISPPNWINWEVEDMKYDFATNYGNYPSQDTKPHISLMHFTEVEKSEKKVLESISKMASNMSTFDISLRGFDFFYTNNSFYIDVESKGPVKNLHDSLLMELDLNKVSFERTKDYTPHMTIGRRLSDSQFRNAFHEFNARSYTNYFRVEYLTVLKRERGHNSWEHLTEIPLKEVG